MPLTGKEMAKLARQHGWKEIRQNYQSTTMESSLI